MEIRVSRSGNLKNSLFIAWLVNSMKPTIWKPFMFLPTTREVWQAVKDMYSDANNSLQIFDLKSRLWHSKQGEGTWPPTTMKWWPCGRNWISAMMIFGTWKCAEDNVRFMKREENDWVFMFLAGLASQGTWWSEGSHLREDTFANNLWSFFIGWK